MGKEPQCRWFGKSTLSFGSHPTSLFIITATLHGSWEGHFKWKARRTNSSKSKGRCSLCWKALWGVNHPGGQSKAIRQLLKQLFLSCVLSIWLELGKSIHFLTWKVFKTPKGFGQEGNIPTTAKSFSVVKTNKQNSKKVITNLLQAIYGPIQGNLSFIYQ